MYSNSMKIQQMLFLPDVTPCLHSDAKRLVIDVPTPWLNTTVTPKDDRVFFSSSAGRERRRAIREHRETQSDGIWIVPASRTTTLNVLPTGQSCST